jgi:hypothetical protein
MTQTNCRIDSELAKELRKYSDITGVPVSKCIDEAVERWLNVVAPSRIEAMTRQADLTLLPGGKVSGLDGHLHVTEEDIIAQVNERSKAKVKK